MTWTRTSETGKSELVLYLVAGVVFVAVGVAFPAFLMSWPIAAAYLLVAVWLLPASVRKALR